jgi:DNA invertase Pin-like site-specific DNA recombinase
MSDYYLDLPPEFCQYRDQGCEFAHSCLNCPLPVCVYDEPGGKTRLFKRKRQADMAQLFIKEGKNIRELAKIYKVSRRTVQRTLKVAFGENEIYSTNPRSEK